MAAAAQFISVDAPCEVRDACVTFAREALAATPVSCGGGRACERARVCAPRAAAPRARQHDPRTPPAGVQVECDAAMAIKRKLEAQFGELWHVVVGRSYGASVAHEAGSMLSFRLRGVAVTAFSSFDESQLVRNPGQRRQRRAGAPKPGGAAEPAAEDEAADDAAGQ